MTGSGVGIGFLLGSISYVEQYFNQTSTTSLLNHLALSIIALIIPAASQVWADGVQKMQAARIAVISRKSSISIILGQGSYFVYAFRTYSAAFMVPHRKVETQFRRRKPRHASQSPTITASTGNVTAIRNTSPGQTRTRHLEHVYR